MPAAPDTRPHSLRFSRERDARVLWLLESHPVTAAMLVRIGWFPSGAKALRRLNRLARRSRIRLVGTVALKPGRPEKVFCRWTPKADQLLHEVQLTQFCLRLDAGGVRRGPHVLDTTVRPDAEVTIAGRVHYVEWDRGTSSYARVVGDRFRQYEGCEHLVLWVCPTEERREGLRLRAGTIRHAALFATAADALACPHGEVWLGYGGDRAALPRETGGILTG